MKAPEAAAHSPATLLAEPEPSGRDQSRPGLRGPVHLHLAARGRPGVELLPAPSAVCSPAWGPAALPGFVPSFCSPCTRERRGPCPCGSGRRLAPSCAVCSQPPAGGQAAHL